jgi:hypothetical protein
MRIFVERIFRRKARGDGKCDDVREGNQARVIGVGTRRQTRLDRNAGLTAFSFEQPWKPAMHAAVASRVFFDTCGERK